MADDAETLQRLRIPPPAWRAIHVSLEDPAAWSLHGRFDLVYGGPADDAKLLEYNADTPAGTNVQDGLWHAVAWTLVFGLIGVLAQAASFRLADVLTPGRLGEQVLRRPGLHPAALLASAAQLATAAVVVASIA